MGVVNKVMDWFGVNSEDEEYEDVENTQVEDIYEEDDSYQKPLNFKSRSFDNDKYASKNGSQVRLMPTSANGVSSKMVITQPESFDESGVIGDYLKGQKSVIVNLENVSKEDARRIIDFMSGATFMVDGTIQKVSSLIYLFTPRNVEIQNDVEQSQYKQKASFSWLK